MISRLFLPATCVAFGGLFLLCGCSSGPDVISERRPASYGGGYYPYHTGSSDNPSRSAGGTQPVVARESPRVNPSSLVQGVNVKADYLPRSARGRSNSRSMAPRYITIHSTQNWSKGADAWRHSLALKRSKLGRLSWHYTIDEDVAVQHLPTNITGNHADYDGPGNRYSIGIEMCEHPGNSRTVTVDRTAKLAAYLMEKYDIPLSRVVPHYHWPRRGANPPNKNCPHYLLTNGRPGSKWRGFLGQVDRYHRSITLPKSNAWASR
jgi:N-acetylmuramoyl-L-alanine amidase